MSRVQFNGHCRNTNLYPFYAGLCLCLQMLAMIQRSVHLWNRMIGILFDVGTDTIFIAEKSVYFLNGTGFLKLLLWIKSIVFTIFLKKIMILYFKGLQ